MAHQRIRTFNTPDVYPGTTLDGRFTTDGDAAAQTEQTMTNVAQLLGELGASVNDICKDST